MQKTTKTAILALVAAAFAVSGSAVAIREYERRGWTYVFFISDEQCPLCIAAAKGDLAKIKSLLDGWWFIDGENPNEANKYGATALMHAADNGHAEVAKVLLVAGANPNATVNDFGYTALMAAAEKGHPEVVKILLAAGANPNAAADDGRTALGKANLILSKLKKKWEVWKNASNYAENRRQACRERERETFTKLDCPSLPAPPLQFPAQYGEIVFMLKEAGAE